MCRIETVPSSATTATRYNDIHGRRAPAGFRTPRRGITHIQNHENIDQCQPCHSAITCNSHCRHSGNFVVDQPQSDWKVVYPKRRHRVKKPIVVDHSDDELINNENYMYLVNRFGEISAKDALANCHDNESFELHAFKLLEGEASMLNPTGPVISSLSDIDEISYIDDMTDYAVQSDDDDILPVLTEGIVNVLSLDIAKICSSYALESVSTSRVDGCITMAPFSKAQNHVNCSISFCKDVETFRHEMSEQSGGGFTERKRA